MFDIGITKLAIVGGIALIVIGPEKLPGLARTVGTLIGRARRYVADVKAEVNRSVDLDSLKKMKEEMEAATRAAESSLQTAVKDIENNWAQELLPEAGSEQLPYYSMARPVKKRWRAKISATPLWYKARSGTRMKALSGAARVARFRVPQSHS